MKLIYFGDYNPDYTRTRILLKGLRSAGAEVVEINERGAGVAVYFRLWKRFVSYRGDYDALIIGYGDRRGLPIFARCIGAKNIVWEALFSKYDNWVHDRKLATPHSLKAYFYWLTDWLGCFVSDLILLDTKLHTDYFKNEFKVPDKKLAYAYVGADTDIFYPLPRKRRSPNFEIEFHGKYFPMQGTEVIIQAAKLLEGENVHFTLIGSGQELKNTKALADQLRVSNVTFKPFLPAEAVAEYVRDADLCVGLIGDVPRVVRAIPTKLWEAAAMSRATINAFPGSVEEVFAPGESVIGLTPGDHRQLAETILYLKKSGKADEIGRAAYETFKRYGTPDIIGKKLVETIYSRFGTRP